MLGVIHPQREAREDVYVKMGGLIQVNAARVS
jgi:hypothetical protein